MKVLVVDDDSVIRSAIQSALRLEGFEVAGRDDAPGAVAETRAWRPDLVLLDLMMPGPMSGLDALRLIRRDSSVPIILITGREEDSYKVLGLEYADDYVVKPFSIPELVGRIRAVMRRAGPHAPEQADAEIRAGELRIDTGTREVTLSGRPLSLTPIEYGILVALASRPGKVTPRDDLTERVWGPGITVDPHTVAVHIRSLRRKLEDDPARPGHLLTVRGVGFRYVP